MTRDGHALEETIELVAQRVEFLECLREESLRKSEIVDALDRSRSTVNRAIDDLVAADLVERVEGEYRTTRAGWLAVQRYRAFQDQIGAVTGAREALSVVPNDAPIDHRPLVGADVSLTDGPTPFEPLHEVERLLRNADAVRAVLPAVASRRALELCRTVAASGEAVSLVLRRDLYEELRDRSPDLLRDIAEDGTGSLYAGETPPFGVYHVEHDGRSTVATVLFTDSWSPHAVVRNDATPALSWGRERFEAARADGRDVTDEALTLTSGDGSDGPNSIGATGVAARESTATLGERLRYELEREGFVELTTDYLDRREPAPPETCWRTGVDLVDVAAGRVVRRDRPDAGGARTPVAEELVEDLTDGEDVALLGPPGSGKSTICKRVAVEWWNDDRGPVFYRESGQREFESVAALDAAIRRSDGPTLVVVEDVVRSEANAVVELMEDRRGDDTVTFLVDAREDEWPDVGHFRSEPRLRTYLREEVVVHETPSLDERECERFVRRYEEAVGHEVDVSPGQLLAPPRNDREDTPERGEAGEVLLALHRLAVHSETDEETVDTALEADARTTLDALVSHGSDRALPVGVLVNLLTAAGIPVDPAYVHALATGGDHDAVRAGLDALRERGVVTETRDGRIETVHESWSMVFLDVLVASEVDASRLFAECVRSVLSLAADPDLRRRVEDAISGESPALTEIAVAPDEWSERLVARLFRIGRDRPKLEPLFRTDRDPLPETVPPIAAGKAARYRAMVFEYVGDLSAAEREYRRVADAEFWEGRPEDEESRELVATCRATLAFVLIKQGDPGDAVDHAERARRSFETLDDEVGLAHARNALGAAALRRQRLDEAADHFRTAIENSRAVDERNGLAKALHNLAGTLQQRGDLEAAREHAREALAIERELGDRRMQATCRKLLGELSANRGEFDAASEHLERAIRVAAEVGAVDTETSARRSLAHVELQRGDYDSAETHVDRCFEAYDETDRPEHALYLVIRSVLERERGDLETAESMATRGLERAREISNPRIESDCHAELADIALERSAIDDAREHATEALGIAEERGMDGARTEWLELCARVERADGCLEPARDYCERSLSLAREMDRSFDEAEALATLGGIDLDAGLYEDARRRLETAVDQFKSMDAVPGAVAALEELARLHADQGDHERVQAVRDRARNLADEHDVDWAADDDTVVADGAEDADETRAD